MEIQFKGNELISEDFRKQLRNPIKKIEFFEKIIVVLLERELNTDFFENVLAFDYSLKSVWQIEKLPEFEYQGKTYLGINKPYTDIVKLSEKELVLFNYDGTKLKVNPVDGQLLVNPMKSRIGKRSW